MLESGGGSLTTIGSILVIAAFLRSQPSDTRADDESNRALATTGFATMGVGLLTAITGWIINEVQGPPKLLPETGVTVACTNDCETKWSAALVWVERNSKWNIRIQTENLISTEGPSTTHHAAFQITKVPRGAGGFEITFAQSCFAAGCPRADENARAFRDFLATSALAARVDARARFVPHSVTSTLAVGE